MDNLVVMVMLVLAAACAAEQQNVIGDQAAKQSPNAETRSDPAKAYLDRGLALFHKGDKDGAIAAYRAAIRLSPSYAEAHNSLGVALSEQGQLGRGDCRVSSRDSAEAELC
ncbi:MAG TPA: tetratricopeptide repeat protein [Candidatus Angelobacter sp.]